MAGSEGAKLPDPPHSPLAAPVAVAIRQHSWRGPFSRPDQLITLRAATFSVVNAGLAAVSIRRITIDPLHHDATGTTVPGALQSDTDTAPLEPGTAATLTLGGAVPARPGTYGTTVRILDDSGASLPIPITLTIPAASAWGIGCMMFGLLLLGAVNFLAGEGAVKTRLHDALQARQAIGSFLETHTVARSRAADVETMNRDFDAAISDLGRRRAISIVDHREPDARMKLQAAEAIAARLRESVAGQPRGGAEVAEVRHDWQTLAPTLRRLAALPHVMPPEPSNRLAGKLDVFLGHFRDRWVRAPAIIVIGEISTELDRMALQEAAGEGDAAQALAVNTRLWLRRSARSVDRAVTLYRTALVQAGGMLNTDRAIRRRAVRDNLGPQDRQAVLSLLDAAADKLDAAGSLAAFRDANHLIDRARLTLTRATARMRKRRLSEAIVALNQQTSWADVQTLLDRLQAAPLPHTLAMKQAGLLQILDLWRAHIAQVGDRAIRSRLSRQIDAMQAIVTAGAMGKIGRPYRTFMNEWAAWDDHLVQQASDRLQHKECLEIYADLERDTGLIEASLRETPSGRDAVRWDRALDRIRVDMDREGPDRHIITHHCVTPLLAIDKRAIALSGTILTAELVNIPLPALTRVRLAHASGLAAAIGITEANLDRPRILTIDTATPRSDRTVGRVLTFRLRGADPVWGSSTLIRIDFGDRSPIFDVNAEELRQGEQITHRYASALTARITAIATDGPASQSTAGAVLGQGRATILVRPSPISNAQRLADEFLNFRFGLALLIALTVYYWRYHSRATTFGARGYDYVEAFALGFAADVAVSHLPQIVTNFVA